VGFVLGPILGGLLLHLPVPADWRLRVPFLVAAGLSTVAWVLVLLWLPESADPAARSAARVLSRRGLVDLITLPGVGRLVLIGALSILAWAALEGTFSLYLRQRMGWTTSGAAFAFGFLGVVSAVVQGGLLPRLVRKHGEVRLALTGLLALTAGLAALALVRTTAGLLGAMFVVAVGQALAGPSVSGLLSRTAPASEQGAVFGTLNSALTLARMVNYLAANRLLGLFGPSAPFWEGAAAAGAAFLLAVGTLPNIPVIRAAAAREGLAGAASAKGPER
jgi:DHA1 family tetracycline resistance protein-like MFS transporter